MVALAGDRLPISVIMLTYNEEANIEACLRSVCDWAGEVFVVDSGSTDRTLEIARRYTDKIFHHPFENYSRQRNWAQQNLPLAYEWVFHIDADERVTPELARSIVQLFAHQAQPSVDGFMVTRRTVFMGRWIRHGGHYPVYHLRLYKRAKGRCEARPYDQHFIVNGIVRCLQGDLIDVIMSDLTTWTARHTRWATLEAQEALRDSACLGQDILQAKPDGTPIERRRWLRVSLYNRCPLLLRAFMYFFYRYLLRLGFLDGIEGLIFHVLQGFWYRFYVDAKICESTRTREN